MKKQINLFLLFQVLLFFISCSGSPREWNNTAYTEKVTQGVGTFSIKVEGYPPFSWEIYDNPQFAGNYKAHGTSLMNEFSVTAPPPAGEARFLRVKSQYGNWQAFGINNDNPKTFGYFMTIPPDGTGNSPFLIENKEDLLVLSRRESTKFGSDPWGAPGIYNFYMLTTDIDLTGIEWTPVGNTSTPFYGDFNGAGHIISGLNNLNTQESGDVAGLFGSIESGFIKNIGLKTGNLKCSDNINYFGALVGKANTTGSIQIQNSYVIGSGITGSPTTSYTGGLLGYGNANISDCYTNINVTGFKTAGGLTASLGNTSSITNCYAAGDVIFSGTLPGFNIGGITGESFDNITGTIALNSRISGTTANTSVNFYYVGPGITGTSYFNRNTYSPGGIRETSAGVFSVATNPYTISQTTPPFINWDFINDWKWDDSINRPVLRKVKR